MIHIKKGKIVCGLIIIVVIVAFSYFSYTNIHSVSYLKEKVNDIDVNPNEAVLIMRYQNNSFGRTDRILIINKNGQAKYVNLYIDDIVECDPQNITEANLLSLCDSILKNKKIPYVKMKFNISKELLIDVINASSYDLIETKRHITDLGTSCFYSVCDIGKKRRIVTMQRNASCGMKSKNRKVIELCKKITDFKDSASIENRGNYQKNKMK